MSQDQQTDPRNEGSSSSDLLVRAVVKETLTTQIRARLARWLIPKLAPKWVESWEEEVKALERAKKYHQGNAGCEHPGTCGACHWYSGAVEGIRDVIYGKGWKD